jgi:hypothetical protein
MPSTDEDPRKMFEFFNGLVFYKKKIVTFTPLRLLNEKRHFKIHQLPETNNICIGYFFGAAI